jgi:hypothetical protein
MHERSTSGAIKDLECRTRCLRQVNVLCDHGICGSVDRYLVVGAGEIKQRGITQHEWIGRVGGETSLPDMMPPSLLAALRHTPLMQPVLLILVGDCAHGPTAKDSKFDRPHIRNDGSIFHVGVFRSGRVGR